MYKDICKGTSNQKILSWIMFHFLQGKLYKIAESQIIFDETLAQCEEPEGILHGTNYEGAERLRDRSRQLEEKVRQLER